MYQLSLPTPLSRILSFLRSRDHAISLYSPCAFKCQIYLLLNTEFTELISFILNLEAIQFGKWTFVVIFKRFEEHIGHWTFIFLQKTTRIAFMQTRNVSIASFHCVPRIVQLCYIFVVRGRTDFEHLEIFVNKPVRY